MSLDNADWQTNVEKQFFTISLCSVDFVASLFPNDLFKHN